MFDQRYPIQYLKQINQLLIVNNHQKIPNSPVLINLILDSDLMDKINIILAKPYQFMHLFYGLALSNCSRSIPQVINGAVPLKQTSIQK